MKMDVRITEVKKREMRHLWFIAKHYYSLSKKLRNKLPENILSKTIGEFANEDYRQKDIVGEIKWAMLMTAHLASCATRLNTIEDILGKSRSPRFKTYDDMRKDDKLSESHLASEATNIIHFILRNVIGHFEPHGMDRRYPSYNIMESYYKKLTFREIVEHMEALIYKMKTDENIKPVIKC
jgi:hypothetical protein